MTITMIDRDKANDANTTTNSEKKTLNNDFVSILLIILLGCICIYLIVQDHNQSVAISSQDVITVSVLWLVSCILGYITSLVGVPPLLGSLTSGILLANIPIDFNISSHFGEFIQTTGLCIILLISGCEIDINKVIKAGFVALRLTLLPGLCEAITSAYVAHWIFDMSLIFSLALGFILAAVSPAIIVPGMTNLKRLGYGVDKGIPSLLMAACAFDDIVAITGYTICIGIALDTTSDNLVLAAFYHGPVAIFLGIVSGCLAGCVLAVVRYYFPHDWQHSIVALELGLIMTYGYKIIGLDGAGAVGTLLIANQLWQHKLVAAYTKCSPDDETALLPHTIGKHINIVWNIVIVPLLFGSIGAAFDLSQMSSQIVFKSCVVIFIAFLVRLPIAFISCAGANLSIKERLFVSSAWCPKATVQAALCSLPLTMIRKSYGESNSILVEWGSIIQTTSILAIIITAPIGLLAIQFLGPHLLSREKTRTPSTTTTSYHDVK